MVTVLMNSYKEQEELFRRAAESAIKAGSSQLIVSTVKGDACIAWALDYTKDLVINEKPGIFQQINAMIPYISQPYLCYQSSNDCMLNNKLYLEVDLILKHKAKVCYSAYNVVDEISGNTYTQEFAPYQYDKHLLGNFVSDCAMVETETFLKHTPFNVRFGNYAYHDLWLTIFEAHGSVFIYNPTPTWVYHITENSQHQRREKVPEWKQANQKDQQEMLKTHNNVRRSTL